MVLDKEPLQPIRHHYHLFCGNGTGTCTTPNTIMVFLWYWAPLHHIRHHLYLSCGNGTGRCCPARRYYNLSCGNGIGACYTNQTQFLTFLRVCETGNAAPTRHHYSIIFLMAMRQEMLYQPKTTTIFLVVMGQEHAAPIRHHYYLSCCNKIGNAAPTNHHY